MTASTIKNRAFKLLKGLLIAVVWVAIWQLLAVLIHREVLFVSPLKTAETLMNMAQKTVFWESVFFSLSRITVGFLLGIIIGILLGAGMFKLKLLRDFLKPLIAIIRATPVASFIILAMLHIKSGWLPIFTAFLMVMPIVLDGMIKGLEETDSALLEMAQSFRFSFFKKIRAVYLPSVLPFLTAGAVSALGLAWKAGVAAEVLAMPKNALGTDLRNAKSFLETPELFALTATIIILSVIIERLFLFLVGRFLSPAKGGSDGNSI